ncbi:MAG: ABC transporter ATP-binding protein [Thermincola sp.]|jgi:ATP-binding cassette subfamily B protein|nr:ABC transporter ATP-binding protein [Thermincola sp.]MDT3702402.1 ABC transporter ATP-binding protein [Thermincola sp.]
MAENGSSKRQPVNTKSDTWSGAGQGPISKSARGSGKLHRRMMGSGGKAKDTITTLKRLWRYLGRHNAPLTFTFMAVAVSSILTLIGPYLIGLAVDAMVTGRGGVDFKRLGQIAAAFLVINVLSSLMSWLQVYFTAGLSQETLRDLRKDLFAKMQTLSLKFFDRRPHGEMMSRLTNDIEMVNNTLSDSVTQLFSSIITVTGSIAMMFYLDPILTLLTLLVVPLGMFTTSKVAGRSKKYFSAQQRNLAELNGIIEETISGQRVVQAFGKEEKSIQKFNAVNYRLKDSAILAQTFSGLMFPIMNMVNNLSYALVAFAGGWMAVQGMISLGVIAAFLNYSRQFARPINDIANQFNMIQAALAGAERVFEVIDEAPEFEDRPEAHILKNIAGEVIFKNVTFGYSDNLPVLKNINLRAEPGQTIALVGPTGAGKTTIVNLLTRFYDVNSGAIYVDGLDIRQVQKESLRSSLGIVLQDSYLFADTVKENIRYGRLDATDQEVENAARLANAESFILRLPSGFDTMLTDEGGNLSQGQRQLLTIARAILADPAILVLDEATSSVDTRTELQIQAAMLSLMKGRTCFVIAHRLSTIHQADQILVINKGEIIERGTHQQLLEARGFYYELYNSQFKGQRHLIS